MIELTPEFALKVAEAISAKATEIASENAEEKEKALQIATSAAEYMGLETGRIVGIAVAALQAGYVAEYRAYMKEHGLDDEGQKQQSVVKALYDCESCQCNYCAKLERCHAHRKGAEEIRKDGSGVPWPCVGCKPGKQFKPCESCGNGEPDCDDWEEMD